jgi:hypothetical protein
MASRCGVAVLRCGTPGADTLRVEAIGALSAQHVREAHRERGSLGAGPAAGEAGGFNAVQKLLANPSSRRVSRHGADGFDPVSADSDFALVGSCR